MNNRARLFLISGNQESIKQINLIIYPLQHASLIGPLPSYLTKNRLVYCAFIVCSTVLMYVHYYYYVQRRPRHHDWAVASITDMDRIEEDSTDGRKCKKVAAVSPTIIDKWKQSAEEGERAWKRKRTRDANTIVTHEKRLCKNRASQIDDNISYAKESHSAVSAMMAKRKKRSTKCSTRQWSTEREYLLLGPYFVLSRVAVLSWDLLKRLLSLDLGHF